jgi:hypothetical protein
VDGTIRRPNASDLAGDWVSIVARKSKIALPYRNKISLRRKSAAEDDSVVHGARREARKERVRFFGDYQANCEGEGKESEQDRI